MSYEQFARYAKLTDDKFWQDILNDAAAKSFQHGAWYKPSENAITFQEDTKNKSSRIYLDLNNLDPVSATERIIKLHQDVIKCFSPTDKLNKRTEISTMIENHETKTYLSWGDVKTSIERGSLINDYVRRKYPKFTRHQIKNVIQEINFALDIGTLNPDSFVMDDNKIKDITDMAYKKGRFKFTAEPAIKHPSKTGEPLKLTNAILKYVEGL